MNDVVSHDEQPAATSDCATVRRRVMVTHKGGNGDTQQGKWLPHKGDGDTHRG